MVILVEHEYNKLGIDSLVYSYDTGGNQLTRVTDSAPTATHSQGFLDGNTTGNDYSYDLNGNMTQDKNKGITQVSYNYLNLPQKIVGTSQTIEYIYSAGGQKLQKKAPNDEKTHYSGNFIYEGTSLKQVLHGEGYIDMSGTPTYHYYLKDHLGNNRMVINQAGTVVQQTDYYPFGVAFNKGGSSDNKYLYNGKELQEDAIGNGLLDWLDYGWRMYDAALGRFTTIDPNVEDNHHNYTPYAYVYNNPIKFIDPFGLDSIQRANAVVLAHDYVGKNPGNSYASGRGAPGEKTDCAGLVSSCIIKGEEPDPYVGKDGNGVSRIAQSSEKVDNNDAEVGNAITLDNSTSGKDKPMGHIGIIVEVKKNENGETTGFKIVDSGGRPSTGKSGPRYTEITIGGSGYWDSRVTGVYKWDTRPDVYNGGTLKQVIVTGQGSPYIKPIPITKVSVK